MAGKSSWQRYYLSLPLNLGLWLYPHASHSLPLPQLYTWSLKLFILEFHRFLEEGRTSYVASSFGAHTYTNTEVQPIICYEISLIKNPVNNKSNLPVREAFLFRMILKWHSKPIWSNPLSTYGLARARIGFWFVFRLSPTVDCPGSLPFHLWKGWTVFCAGWELLFTAPVCNIASWRHLITWPHFWNECCFLI